MADTPRGPILKKMFAEMDSNGDGVIDEKEGLAIGRLLAGGNAGEAKRFWEEMKAGADTDKNGTVSLDEYVNYGRDVTSANDCDAACTPPPPFEITSPAGRNPRVAVLFCSRDSTADSAAPCAPSRSSPRRIATQSSRSVGPLSRRRPSGSAR